MIAIFIRKMLLLTLLTSAAITMAPNHEAEASADPYIGEIQLFPYNFAPRGWAVCEGQLLSISTNTALFSLLGTNFGGNGMTTFALPDLRGAEPSPYVRYYISLQGVFPARD
ncbi:phage tail protein [Ammoniphilus sp. YIM 78166]|uniref:phage tail protein n=1 Tax=Ammoniphilus sp. YIM 78166 TaxID=1644106 RepID=UPI0010704837|nr:tail fiber protein [Ammoniphilus sp. YIM 78166]